MLSRTQQSNGPPQAMRLRRARHATFGQVAARVMAGSLFIEGRDEAAAGCCMPTESRCTQLASCLRMQSHQPMPVQCPWTGRSNWPRDQMSYQHGQPAAEEQQQQLSAKR